MYDFWKMRSECNTILTPELRERIQRNSDIEKESDTVKQFDFSPNMFFFL